MAFAFRCKNCNTLETAEYAGERDVPIKCATCGAGVSFDKQGVKTEDPDNWIVLADLSDAELKKVTAYHGDIEVEKHTPIAATDPGRAPRSLHVVAAESNVSEDQS